MGLFRRAEKRATLLVGDPAFADFFGLGTSTSGVNVTEVTALGQTAVWRAVHLIAGTIATLPMKSFRKTDDGKEQVTSFLDNPAGPESFTPFEWKETVMAHLLLHGNAFLLHVYNGGGALVGLNPIHPSAVSVERRPELPGGKLFTVSLDDGSVRTFTPVDLTHIPGLLVPNELRGYSTLSTMRNALGTGIAGDRSAARMFANGAMISGLVTPEDDLTEEEAKQIKESLRNKMLGTENAGDIAVINRKLSFTPWSLSNEDAQFLESRGFQIDEVARIFGVPKVLLAEDGASTWGSGIAELVRGFQKFTLAPWTKRIEQRLSLLLSSPRFVEFEFKGLLQPSPAEEVELMARQLELGLLTLDEARALMNRPPIPAGVEPAPGGEPEAPPAGPMGGADE